MQSTLLEAPREGILPKVAGVWDSFHWKILLSSFFFRTWRRPIVTPRLLLTTLCLCLIMKEVVPKLLVWAPWTPQSQTETRTMTTWMNGAIASRSWQICTEVARTTRGLDTDDGERNWSLSSCDGKCWNNFFWWFFSSFHLRWISEEERLWSVMHLG